MVKFSKQYPAFFLVALFLAFSAIKSYSYEQSQGRQDMPRAQSQQTPSMKKNLKGVAFAERSEVEGIIDTLEVSAKDPYAASLPMIASARLGDQKRYQITLLHMLETLVLLDTTPESCPEWMRNNGFKAWMWGRVLLAADSIDDANMVDQAKSKLASLLAEKMTKDDNFAFITWAWGHRAALNEAEYEISAKTMMEDAKQLSTTYKEKNDHSALSDALWGWVMNLSAAANVKDQDRYQSSKDQIKSLTGAESVTQALETGLWRNSKSNDYPAWALAKACIAAILMVDKAFYKELNTALTTSIKGAKNGGAGSKPDYILALIDAQLALPAGNEMLGMKQVKPRKV